MMRRTAALLASALLLVALPLGAAAETFYLSQPGLCGADDGVIEERDVIYLQDRGINSHFFGCDFPNPVLADLAAGRELRITSKCASATTRWTADFILVPQGDGNVKAHQTSGGLSPVLFYRCTGG
ncbi:hypothetical protein N4R57_15240 [Rhodobacteraceae bacterium D3-12]|nr:hypothetical protein N4R57_15240 [Rhodobacteraceae bacterium D3-12]